MLAIALIAALAGGPPAQPAPDDGRVAAPAAMVKVASCSRASRSAVFYSRVRRLARGQRMWMRFTLLERGADGRYMPVAAPGLQRWRKSKPGVKVFGYSQRVRGLTPGSAYRARVAYRWHGADGRLDRKVTRRSRVCSQAGPLPNLRARIVATAPGSAPGTRRYTVRLVNAGRGPASDASVRLAVEGAGSQTKTVARVAPGTAAFLDFDAAECITAVTADADPGGTVAESNESDNGRRTGCAELPR